MATLLYILDYYLPHKWGVETVFEQIINRSLKEWYKVIVLTSWYDKNLKKEETIWDLQIIRAWNSRKSFVWQWFIKGRKILKNNPDIIWIHTSTYGWAIPASFLWKFYNKKVLLTVHEIFWKLWNRYKPRYSAWIYRLFERFIFQLHFDLYHCVSSYTLNSLRVYYWISDKKLFLAHNGVDYDFWDKKKVTKEESKNIRGRFWLDNKRNLLYFWHTWISKGIDLLIDSTTELLNQEQDLQLIYNFIPAKRDSYIKEKLKSNLMDLPSKERWRVKIWNGLSKEELRALVANVDWVIAPSLSEGFWSVHTETLALWVPLITTYVASLPEVVWWDVIFFAPDNKEDLCKAVHKLKVWDYKKLEEKHFSWDDQYKKLLDWYKSL